MENQENVPLAPVFQVPFSPPIDNPNKTAEWAQVLEIDFDIKGRHLWFYFSRRSKFIPISGQSDLDRLINNVCNISYKWDYNVASYPKINCASPLSLMNDQNCYVIYKLSDRNWQFVRIGRPITVGKLGMDKKAYFNGKRVFASASDSDPGTEFDADPATARDGSKVAYFIADAREAGRNEPNNHYDHAINLHVDLIFEAQPPLPTSTSVARYYMPLVIDPDIRYPGGSQP